MKNTLLLLVFITFALPAFSQKIRFTEGSNVWTTRTITIHSVSHTQHIGYHAYVGDTTMYGHQYFKLDIGGAFVREDTSAGLVYIRMQNAVIWGLDTSEQILYNYNLAVGDTIRYRNLYAYNGTITGWVVTVDSTEISGVWHKVWYLEG